MKKYTQLYLTLILGFILGIHDGNIALWKNGASQPAHVFPYRAEMLPPDAQSALRSGIPIGSLQELEALAENYLS